LFLPALQCLLTALGMERSNNRFKGIPSRLYWPLHVEMAKTSHDVSESLIRGQRTPGLLKSWVNVKNMARLLTH